MPKFVMGGGPTKPQKQELPTDDRRRLKYFRKGLGASKLRVFTFDHTITQADMGDLKRFDPSAHEVGETITGLAVKRFIHWGIGESKRPVPCGRLADYNGTMFGSCPHCETSWKARDAGDEAEADRYKVTARMCFWVLDMDDIEAGLQRYDAPATVYRGIEEAWSAFGDQCEMFGYKGRDFTVTKTTKDAQGRPVSPAQMYSVVMSPMDCKDLSHLDLQEPGDLYHDPDMVPEHFQALVQPDLEELPQDVLEPKPKKPRKVKKPKEDHAGKVIEIEIDGEAVEGVVEDWNYQKQKWVVEAGGEKYLCTEDEMTFIEETEA